MKKPVSAAARSRRSASCGARAAGGDETAFRKFFRRDLHAGLVRNLRKVGVLSDRVAPDLEALGISLAAA
jgi:hypothetical protein